MIKGFPKSRVVFFFFFFHSLAEQATIDCSDKQGDFDFEATFHVGSRSFTKVISSVSLFRRNSTSSIGSKHGEDERTSFFLFFFLLNLSLLSNYIL